MDGETLALIKALSGGGGGGGSSAPSTYYGYQVGTPQPTDEIKYIQCPEFVLSKGVILVAHFAQGNTASNLKLNVNDTGAKSVKIRLDVTSSNNRLMWDYATDILFIYDGDYWSYISAVNAYTYPSYVGARVWYGVHSSASGGQINVITTDGHNKRTGDLIIVTVLNSSNYNGQIGLYFNNNSGGSRPVYVNGAITSVQNPLHWHEGDTLTFVDKGNYYEYVSNSRAIEPPLVVLITFHYVDQPVGDNPEVISSIPAQMVWDALQAGKPVVIQARVVSEMGGVERTSVLFSCKQLTHSDADYRWYLEYNMYCPTNTYPLKNSQMPVAVVLGDDGSGAPTFYGETYADNPSWLQSSLMSDTDQTNGYVPMYTASDDAVYYKPISYDEDFETALTSVLDPLISAALSAGHIEGSMQITDPYEVSAMAQSLGNYMRHAWGGQPCRIAFTSYALFAQVVLLLTSATAWSETVFALTFEGEADAISSSSGSLTDWTGFKIALKMTMQGDPSDGGFIATAVSITKKDYPLLNV